MEALFVLLAIALALFVPVSCIAMWVRTGNLQEEIERLKWDLLALKAGVAPPDSPAPAAPTPSPVPTPAPRSSVPLSSAPLPPRTVDLWEDEAPKGKKAQAPRETYQAGRDAARRDGFEFNFGQKLPVWIGGVALALAGFYLVKYTIEKDLLTEKVRVLLGILFGAALIFGARFIRVHKSGMADAQRIMQTLSGAGIAVLYAAVYAAVSLYGIISPFAGFAGLAMVTLLACLLALLHGMPVAVLGLMGGFVTPALIATDHPNLGTLLIYLYCLLTGLLSLIRRQDWWVLGLPTLALAFLWIFFWMFGSGHFGRADGFLLGLFIVASSATVIHQTRALAGGESKASSEWRDALNYTVAGGAVLMMGLVAAQSGFRPETWALYGLLGVGSLVMAWFRPVQYRLAPWLSLAVSLIMLLAWEAPSPGQQALVLLAFAALFGGGALFLLRQRPALDHAGLLSAAALGFYAAGFLKMREEIYALLNIARGETLHLWGFIALALAALFALLTAGILRSFAGEEKLRQRLLAVGALTTTAFLSIALTIEVREDFLAVAFAAELLAVCWVNAKVDIRALRQIAAILLGVFAVLMFHQLLMLFALVVHSLFGQSLDFWHGRLPLATDPLFQLGLPAVMTGLSAWLVQRQRDGRLAELLEMAAVGLGALLLYYGTRNLLHVPADVLFRKPGFVERGLITNLFYAAGLVAVFAGRFYSRRAIVWSGTALFFMALFRTFWFDVVTANPLFTGQGVGAVPLVNGLALAYLFPAFWLWLEERPQLRLATMAPALRGGMMLALAFLFITLNLRQAFHGAVLTRGPTSGAETLSYTLAWLALGGALLVSGTRRQDKVVRSAAIVVILLTIGKVFFHDTGALKGLYLVSSFLSLGVCMIGLSWFYSRFVFGAKDTE